MKSRETTVKRKLANQRAWGQKRAMAIRITAALFNRSVENIVEIVDRGGKNDIRRHYLNCMRMTKPQLAEHDQLAKTILKKTQNQ